jgi:hypothetical protein
MAISNAAVSGEKSPMLKIVKVVSGLLSLAFWFSSFVIWQFYDANKPTTHTTETEFPLNTHGSIVYLAVGEYYLLCGLMAAGVGRFILTAFCHFLGRRRATRNS